MDSYLIGKDIAELKARLDALERRMAIQEPDGRSDTISESVPLELQERRNVSDPLTFSFRDLNADPGFFLGGVFYIYDAAGVWRLTGQAENRSRHSTSDLNIVMTLLRSDGSSVTEFYAWYDRVGPRGVRRVDTGGVNRLLGDNYGPLSQGQMQMRITLHRTKVG